MKSAQARHIQAPEIYGDFWFNANPLSLHDLQGSAVMVFFWDYSSLESLRALHLVRKWHERYGEYGFQIIGVHSPDYEFSREPRRVASAVERLGVRFPVATDNTRTMREAYGIRELPGIILVDREGGITEVFDATTPAHRMERAMQALLRDAGYRGELPLLIEAEEEMATGLYGRPSPMVRAGFMHGALGNVEGYNPEIPAAYTDPRVHLEGRFYAEGTWTAHGDSFEYGGDPPGSLVFRFSGSAVSAVMSSEEAASFVEVQIDDAKVGDDRFGDDLRSDGKGRTGVFVHQAGLYNLFRDHEFGEHTLRLIPERRGLIFYAATFRPAIPAPWEPPDPSLLHKN